MASFHETEPDATHPCPIADACTVAYASHALLRSTGLDCIDHAIWFHERFHADDSLRYDMDTRSAGPGRVLCRGAVFDRSGLLVATVVQEAG